MALNLDFYKIQDKFAEWNFLNLLRQLLPTGYIWGFSISDGGVTRWQDTPEGSGNPQFEDTEQGSGNPQVQDNIESSAMASDSNSTLGQMLSVFAFELFNIHRFTERLWINSIPGCAEDPDGLLTDWERVLNTDDGCDPNYDSQTVEERQEYADYIYRTGHTTENGLNNQFYIDNAAFYGITIQITEFSESQNPFQVADIPDTLPFPNEGSRVDDRLNDAYQYSFVQIEVLTDPNNKQTVWECRLQEIKPAHTVIDVTLL